MHNKLLDLIFGLPPVERRTILRSRWIEEKFFFVGMLQKEHDDLYIYYLAFKWSLIVAPLLLCIYALSYYLHRSIGPSFFLIDARTFVDYDALLVLFPSRLAQIQLFVLVPFYLLMFLYRFNPATYDLGSWNTRLAYARRQRPEPTRKNVPTFILGLLLFVAIIFCDGDFFVALGALLKLRQSFVYVCLSLGFLIFFNATMVRFILMTMLVTWRCLLKSSSNTTVNQIRRSGRS